ncbi:MAG TPA: phosphatase PAP2 family protein [Poseidonia sp.]|nr:phosphatase PAP2 family protein [Poseidonia sp.]
MQSVYLTWVISALALGVILLPVFKPPWANISLPPFVDFFRRYWVHILIVFVIYNAKDGLDQIDRLLMANTGLDMTPYIWAIEGNLVLWVQQTFLSSWLTTFLTHFYVAGFMFICYVSIFYFAYFDDRWLADRVTLSIAWVYIIAIPFYLFFNVRVTGDTIPEMQTLAYTLTPEIADWFRRIDPFTNGMPSLHIGIPFAVWLCLTRFDDDRRWNRYRHTVFLYTAVTAFAIIYLGIHWFLDIIGGMLIAGAAVSLADRTSNTWWKFFDERTMNARIVTVLTKPKDALNLIKGRIQSSFRRYRSPTSKETGRIAFVIFIVVSSVITWDLTHSALPAGGVEAPEGAAAVDGWLVTLDNQSGEAILLVHNLSNAGSEPYEITSLDVEIDSPYAISGTTLIVANSTHLSVVDVEQPNNLVFSNEMERPEQLMLVDNGAELAIIYVQEGSMQGMNLDGSMLSVPLEPFESVVYLAGSGSEVAFVTSEKTTSVFIVQMGVIGQTEYLINATAAVEEDEILASWGTPVDMQNASIVDIAFNREYLAVTVNVSATDRLVVYNRSTAMQWLGSNAKYHVSDPSIGNGILAWAARDFYNPLTPRDEYLDREIYFTTLGTNTTQPLTVDENDQWGPQVLENHLVYFQLEGETVSVEIHSWEPELRLYSSIILQLGVILAAIMVFFNMWQRQGERRAGRILHPQP